MSFEGYYQLICKKGHSYQVGLYGLEEKTPCPVCNSVVAWWNIVDITNGSFEANKRIDGYITLKIKSQKICEHCTSVLETIYNIPKKGGHKQ